MGKVAKVIIQVTKVTKVVMLSVYSKSGVI